MKLPKWLERTMRQLELLLILAAVGYSLHCYFTMPSPGNAIFWILVAIFFGRGQAANYLAAKIREEMERDPE